LAGLSSRAGYAACYEFRSKCLRAAGARLPHHNGPKWWPSEASRKRGAVGEGPLPPAAMRGRVLHPIWCFGSPHCWLSAAGWAGSRSADSSFPAVTGRAAGWDRRSRRSRRSRRWAQPPMAAAPGSPSRLSPFRPHVHWIYLKIIFDTNPHTLRRARDIAGPVVPRHPEPEVRLGRHGAS
jgi:hypothetical protein